MGINGTRIDPSARLLSEAISDLGWKADPKALADRVRQLQQGLPAEDEFALLLTWLGKCALVHRLDQAQAPPNSKSAYRIPDLLAIFRYKDREIPVLIEVKTSAEKHLSWRPDYYDGLSNYAKRLRLPLLLAWNWTKFGFWILCDVSVFDRPETNYRLTFETAMRHSLMCELAGDFSYVFQPGVGLHFKLEKLEQLPSENPPAETYNVRISEAYFTDAQGAHLNTLGPGVFWLFVGSEQDTETDDHPDYFDHRFIMAEESPMQAAHRLVALVTLGLGATELIPWRQLLQDHSFSIGGQELAEEAEVAIGRHIIRYVFRQQPAELPAFLKQEEGLSV
jgi:Holliday junction resolvase